MGILAKALGDQTVEAGEARESVGNPNCSFNARAASEMVQGLQALLRIPKYLLEKSTGTLQIPTHEHAHACVHVYVYIYIYLYTLYVTCVRVLARNT